MACFAGPQALLHPRCALWQWALSRRAIFFSSHLCIHWEIPQYRLVTVITRPAKPKWKSVFACYKGDDSSMNPSIWSSKLIHHLWIWAHPLWMHCNRILHGATTEKAAMRQLQEFQKVVSQLHSESEISPNMLLPRHHYLFLNKSLYHRLQQPYDDIWCWLRSVEEAHLVLLHQKDQHRMDAHWYFPSSPDSTYSASTMPVHTLLLTLTTTLDTVTTTTFITSGHHLLQAIRYHSAFPTFNSYIRSFFSLWVITACQLMIFVNKPLSHIFFRYDILNHYMQLQHLLGINGLDSPSVSAPTLSSPPLCHK